MVRIAVLNPTFLLIDHARNFNGYNYEFFKRYVDVIYITDIRLFVLYRYYCFRLKKKVNFVFSVSSLNKCADVLISFNGVPYKKQHKIPSKFNGIKIVHLMDYNFCAMKSNEALIDSGVDFVLGYSLLDEHCSFFMKFYPSFVGKVFAVPFGYGERFSLTVNSRIRIPKAIALGSVNPVDDPLADSSDLEEFIVFFHDFEFSHPIRRKLVLMNGGNEYFDDQLPVFPNTKNPDYDPVDLLRKYDFFINDHGILNFPPARTYEGIAAGAIMVAPENKIYTDLGFVDGVNCILFLPGDIGNMFERIAFYKNNPELIETIRINSLNLASCYDHLSISNKLYQDISNIFYMQHKR